MGAAIELVLERLVAASVHAAVLAAVVWALCRLLPRLPPAAQCWLWWLVALQAAVGLCMDPLQLPWLPAMPPATATLVDSPIPLDTAGWQLLAGEGPGAWAYTLILGWMGGVAVMGGFTLRQWQRTRAVLRRTATCDDAQLVQSLAAAAGSCGLRRAPALRLSQDIDSPMLVGHFRPVLLLPVRMALSAGELDMAIAHELQHLKRSDLWWGGVPALARHLFFFHPFVHLAVREYGIAREADCDASVVAAERHSRHDYGNLLLRLGTRPAADTELAVASPTFHALSRRLTMLQNMTFLSRTGSLVLVLVVAAIGVTPLRLVAAAATVAVPPASQAPRAAPASSTTRAVPAAGAPSPTAAPKNATSMEQPAAALKTAAASTAPSAVREGRGITSIDFRRAAASAATGRLVVAVDDARVPVNIRQAGNDLVVDFVGADVPANLRRKYDVRDFATPVGAFNVLRTSSGSQLVITTAGDFEHLAYWAGGEYVLEIKARGAEQAPMQAEVPGQPEKMAYTGERMTASFQDIDLRTLLKLIADISGRNILVHDAVTGSVTLKFNNRPWDEVLDIVLTAKGLEKRVQDGVIWVFPAGAGAPAAPAAVVQPSTGAVLRGTGTRITGTSMWATHNPQTELTCTGCTVAIAPDETLEASASKMHIDRNTGVTYLSEGSRVTLKSGASLSTDSMVIRTGADGAREISGDEIRLTQTPLR